MDTVKCNFTNLFDAKTNMWYKEFWRLTYTENQVGEPCDGKPSHTVRRENFP